MIARSWRGAVKPEDAEAYAAYIDETGMKAYASTPGNRGRVDARSARSAR